MSIIYDALQKTQSHRARQPAAIKKTFFSLPWFDLGMLLTIIVLFSVVIYAYYPKIISKLNQPQLRLPHAAPIKTTAVIPVTKMLAPHPAILPTLYATGSSGKITLNGVFLSDHDKFAMINNQTLHIGDTVEGMKVIAIELDQVHLRDDKTNLILRAMA